MTLKERNKCKSVRSANFNGYKQFVSVHDDVHVQFQSNVLTNTVTFVFSVKQQKLFVESFQIRIHYGSGN